LRPDDHQPTFAPESLLDKEAKEERATVIAECETPVIPLFKAMWNIDVKSFFNTLFLFTRRLFYTGAFSDNF
jgi:hypothetical protein